MRPYSSPLLLVKKSNLSPNKHHFNNISIDEKPQSKKRFQPQVKLVIVSGPLGKCVLAMPFVVPDGDSPRVTKFTNCCLLQGKQLVERDLWIDSRSGKILNDQEAFYERYLSPDQVVDLDGRILAPGFIDAQLNGAHGFDFSTPQNTRQEYERRLRRASGALARTGVTSYLPTVVSSTPDVYRKVGV